MIIFFANNPWKKRIGSWGHVPCGRGAGGTDDWERSMGIKGGIFNTLNDKEFFKKRIVFQTQEIHAVIYVRGYLCKNERILEFWLNNIYPIKIYINDHYRILVFIFWAHKFYITQLLISSCIAALCRIKMYHIMVVLTYVVKYQF